MLTLYARREPTTDSLARKYAPNAKLNDVVFYRDQNAIRFYARQMWDGTLPAKMDTRICNLAERKCTTLKDAHTAASATAGQQFVADELLRREIPEWRLSERH